MRSPRATSTALTRAASCGTSAALACASALVLSCPTPATAGRWQAFPVDDAASRVVGPVPWQWGDALPSRRTATVLRAHASVHVVLALGPWVGRPARIYMAMPPVPQSSVSARWTTAGTLLPGALTGGRRQLVFEGIVPAPRLDDTLNVELHADARDALVPQQLTFDFQIEVPTP